MRFSGSSIYRTGHLLFSFSIDSGALSPMATSNFRNDGYPFPPSFSSIKNINTYPIGSRQTRSIHQSTNPPLAPLSSTTQIHRRTLPISTNTPQPPQPTNHHPDHPAKNPLDPLPNTLQQNPSAPASVPPKPKAQTPVTDANANAPWQIYQPKPLSS